MKKEKELFNFKEGVSLPKQKRSIYVNMSRTKSVDNFCRSVIKILDNRFLKNEPDLLIKYLKSFCEERLQFNIDIRKKSLEKIEELNIIDNQNKHDNNEGVEWIK
jgi:hypothetical protein